MLLALVVILQPGLFHCFKPLFSPGSTSHRVITERAILRKTAEVCRDIAVSAGQDFTLTIDNSLSAADVEAACSSSSLSSLSFYTSIATVYLSNGYVDVVFARSPARHFDNEMFQAGRDIITAGMKSIDDSVELENFIFGRLALGQICHTLQDFYSHSNWVELENDIPYSALINSEQTLDILADINTPTCRNCIGDNCEDNLLPELQQQRLLTSGYFGLFSSKKPPGKCSHGGFFDRTSRTDPVGGINKDTTTSSHGRLHPKAVDLAVLATMELLEEIRVAAGDTKFLQLMGLSQASALCFVIDTTGSMSNDIVEAKRVSLDIIDRRRENEEISTYILVPFNDPDFGPLTRTTNADVFKERINNLTPNGGGDTPEMSMSGLQLALTAAPPSSEIYVFTDAPAKDFHLKSTVLALIESSKSVVNFMITDITRRVVRNDENSGTMRLSDVQLYYDLARASGGQAVQISKSELSLATGIIEDSLAVAVVTVFQAVRNPGRPDDFTLVFDSSLINVTVYVTGLPPLTINLTDPSGVTQISSQSSAPLASISTTGNLHRLRIHPGAAAGSWKIGVDSTNSYSVKVTGQSSVNFFFNVVEANEGSHGDFSLKDGRPLSGGNISLLVTVTGSNTVKVTEVTLVDTSGQTEVNGTLQSLGSGTFLVTFTDVPSGDYGVHLRGEDNSSTTRSTPIIFQRQASTQIKTSGISLTAQADVTSIEPGANISVQFTVTTTSSGSAAEMLAVQATNDRGYELSSPSSISVAPGSTANGTVGMTVPAGATSGTDVTLTIEARNAAGTDNNYAVLRFLVAAKATDVTRPVCHVSSLGSCHASSADCASTRWEFVANFTDGINGTGIRRVSVQKGNGTLNTSSAVGAEGENITMAIYSASCCSDSAELAAVDRAGNVGRCAIQARQITTTSSTVTSVTSPPTGAPLSTAGHSLSRAPWFWMAVSAFFLWKVK